jgi:hypothetical protein
MKDKKASGNTKLYVLNKWGRLFESKGNFLVIKVFPLAFKKN